MPAEASTRKGSYALVAGAVGALAVGWLARGGERGQTAAHPPQATRHSFQDLRSSSVARPSRTDSPDLEAWLTTTREGLIHQRATLARQKVSPSTVVFDVSMIPGADAGRRRGVMYIGNAPLPARSTVALYRCLLVRHDAYAEMVRDGTVASAFWNQYAIAMAWPPEPRVCRTGLEPQPSRLKIDLPLTRASRALDSNGIACRRAIWPAREATGGAWAS